MTNDKDKEPVGKVTSPTNPATQPATQPAPAGSVVNTSAPVQVPHDVGPDKELGKPFAARIKAKPGDEHIANLHHEGAVPPPAPVDERYAQFGIGPDHPVHPGHAPDEDEDAVPAGMHDLRKKSDKTDESKAVAKK